MLSDKPFIVIDLYSGRYTNDRVGHEVLNFEWNETVQKYLGYCPPLNNIVIQRLGAKQNEKVVHNVIVIYVRKSGKTSDREIIGFTDNATIHRPGVKATPSIGRTIEDTDGSKQHCDYCIESDTLYDLRSLPLSDKFIIRIAEHPRMFRKQRFYKGKYPELDESIIQYLEDYLAGSFTDNDFNEQENIQMAILPKDGGKGAYKAKPEYKEGLNGKAVKKRHYLAKQVLHNSGYKCAVCADHDTFLTNNGVQYMEGHHLIPCTPSNAKRFWEKYEANIDCIENIVCICPTCHRQIHFGSDADKREVIEKLYEVKKAELESAGIRIEMKELEKLYQVR